MSAEKTPQTMKPATAAKKLGIYLPAAPQDFQDAPVTRAQFLELQANPPAWLEELRRNGPHPRPVVAQKLNVSISGLARGGVTEALTSAEITALLQAPPAWLVEERASYAAVRAENQRVKDAEEKRLKDKAKREAHEARKAAEAGR
jgi:hypothetical protein